MNAVDLTLTDLALASTLILINGAISLAFGLRLERTLLINTIRMVVQLALIGLILKWIFTQASPVWTIGLACVMISVAGFEVAMRQERRFSMLLTYGLGFGTLLFVGLLTTSFTLGAIIVPDPVYDPRYVLTILGMILGNTMTGVALVMNAMTQTASRERRALEARLAMGQPRFEAMRDVLGQSLRTGLLPILNAMAASGVVALPGMMTGQILAGADPVSATKYQILIMFAIAGATALGVLIAGLGTLYLLTDERHRLRLDRLTAIKSN
ncbi:MAG: ABC transporter permease [Pseudomonadota bacterium]